MPVLSGHGIAVTLPAGWDGRIYRRAPGTRGAEPAHSAGAAAIAVPPSPSPAVLQVANVPLPATSGDFGGGAVEQLGPGGIVLIVFEYPGSSGTALFRAQGIPANLRPTDFSPAMLQRAIAGHVGVQRFFTESGRAFSLYAVLGDQPDRSALVAVVNGLLRTVVVRPVP